jgi:hypothetical protein
MQDLMQDLSGGRYVDVFTYIKLITIKNRIIQGITIVDTFQYCPEFEIVASNLVSL